MQERFQREAAILEEFGGANDQIPALYAYFFSRGQFYLVQEWIQGDTLTGKVQKQGLFSEGAVQELFMNLLPVLDYVHSRHIVHRDTKPDNIIVRHRDGKPVLIDFGAVRECEIRFLPVMVAVLILLNYKITLITNPGIVLYI